LPLITAGIAVLLLGLLAICGWRVRGTTLLAVVCWTALCVFVIAGSSLRQSEPAVGDWRLLPLAFAAIMIVFCPGMALLGAKRPQNGPWQLIVFSLWVILALPGLEAWVRGSEMIAELHPARSWFLAILLLVGTVNHLPTRFWRSTLLFAAGQAVLVAPWLPVQWSAFAPEYVVPITLGLWVLAIGWAVISTAVVSGADVKQLVPLDRPWVEFRDAFGAVWALRVIERINSAATAYQWPIRLNWDGFESLDKAGQVLWTGELQGSVRTVMANVLRRFVSQAWIDSRVAEPPSRTVE
jgi:hypothetical protein